jgi:serine/threonine protein kinase/WD40 repeat protein
MDSSDSLQIDEHLAKLLAAYDQSMDGADSKAPTIGVHRSDSAPPLRPSSIAPSPLHSALNEGSLTEVLPERKPSDSDWMPRAQVTPPPGGAPHRIGRFELRRQLGKGGCGIVFLAFDPKLEREVALKIPRPEMLLSDDARRRLIREALAAAEFDHPNLVPVYETGEIGPVCFIATAFCPGLTLGEWLDKQSFPVPVRQAARLMAIISEAVQHAHDRGVLHRDLKPSNVILQEQREDPHLQEPPVGSCQLRGDNYIPRIVDFGLAKLLERGGPSDTTTRQILGTPKYMAPEQAQARHDDIGPAADVYALGVILYELLTGRAPYEGATDVEVLRQSIEGQLTHPRQLRNDVPRDLEAICLKAMARSTARRYRTAIDLADDLRRFLDGKPTLARPLNRLGRAARWLRRNDQAVALAVVTTIATLLMAFWVASTYTTRQLRSDRDKALGEQAERIRSDQRREYARRVREAFLAWRSGDIKAALLSLEGAAKLARNGGESIDFAHGYLGRLLAAERQAIMCNAGPITAVAVSPRENLLATGHHNGSVMVWRRATGEQLCAVVGHNRPVEHLSFRSADALTSGDSSRVSKQWRVAASGELTPVASGVSDIEWPVAGVFPTACSGGEIYVGGEDGVLRMWNSPADEPLILTEHLEQMATAIGVSPDGSLAIVATAAPQFVPYVGTARQAPLAGVGNLVAIHWPREQPGLAVVVRDGFAVGRDVPGAGESERFRIQPPGALVTCAALTTDGARLAIGDNAGHVTIWRTADQTLVKTVTTGESRPVARVAIPDESALVAFQIGDRLYLHSHQEQAPRATYLVDEHTLFRFAHDGNRLVTTRRGGVLKVLSTLSGQEEHTLYGHVGPVTALGVSPNGRTLVSGGANGEIKFWDLRVGQESLSFQRHHGPVLAIEFSSNGRMLVTAGSDVAFWPTVKD